MLIATWNVNSLNARMPRVEEWLEQVQPDVLCMQETKLADDAFPALTFQGLGYLEGRNYAKHVNAVDQQKVRAAADHRLDVADVEHAVEVEDVDALRLRRHFELIEQEVA